MFKKTIDVLYLQVNKICKRKKVVAYKKYLRTSANKK